MRTVDSACSMAINSNLRRTTGTSHYPITRSPESLFSRGLTSGPKAQRRTRSLFFSARWNWIRNLPWPTRNWARCTEISEKPNKPAINSSGPSRCRPTSASAKSYTLPSAITKPSPGIQRRRLKPMRSGAGCFRATLPFNGLSARYQVIGQYEKAAAAAAAVTALNLAPNYYVPYANLARSYLAACGVSSRF